MFRLRVAVLATCLLAFPAAATATEYNRVQADKSSISFVSKQMGAPSEGRFGKFAAQIAFDPASPEQGRAQIEVDLASINAGSADANDEVKGKSWFNVREYPVAIFVASHLKPLGGSRFEAAGKMTIKGRTRDVVAPFTAKVIGNANAIELDGAIPLQRLQFGIGEGVWSDTATVADEVRVRFRFTVTAASVPSSKK